jgi:hypothetical protein
LQDAFEYDVLLAELVEQCVIFPNQSLRYLNGEGGLSFRQPFLLAQKYLLEVLNVPMDRFWAVTGFPTDLFDAFAFKKQLSDNRLFMGQGRPRMALS